MHQDPPNELVRLEPHGLLAAGSLDPVVLVAERYAGRVGGDEAAVGDRDTVGVAGQIGQHLLRPGERPLAADLARSCNDVRKCSFWWFHRFTISRGAKRYWFLEKLSD
jgi:hypothetical protein